MEHKLMEELRKASMELWLRAESWKSALEHIQKINTDPIVGRYIKRALNQENY